jgi:asparagine synthase (glutamine-hydrolysing)
MCGIVAIWSPAGGLQPGDLAAPVRALRHRGPDGQGTWAAPSGQAALGHTRLAVIDLETGEQPLSDAEDRYHLVASGEFYGYEAIRAELLRRGARLRSATDSEIALHLYAADGWRALHRLRGEFALVIWDDQARELFAARDRFGVKPLYYAEHRGRLIIASEIKALLACGVPARWDQAAFADHLLVCYPAERTLLEGIRQVPPGHYLRAGPDGVSVHPYWDLCYPPEDELPAWTDPREPLAAIESALGDAVRVRMRADVPVAYHLSGGVDSSSVVALAGGAGGGGVPVFTVRFGDPALDETAVARRTANYLGAQLTEIAFGPEDFADGLRQVVASGEMIQENSHGIARLLQSTAIREHGFKVVQAGEGGDEMFAGYPQLRKDLAFAQSEEVRVLARRSYARLAANGNPHHLQVLLQNLGFLPNWIIERYLTVTLPLQPFLRPGFARLVRTSRPGADLLDRASAAGRLRGRSPYHQSAYLFCKTWLCNYILAAERLDMARALEVRLPFLDHHVADVAAATPLAWCVRGGVSKAALREAMRRHLPEEVYRGPKKGFFAPAAVENDASLKVMRDVVAGDALDHQPFFDPARVRALFERLGTEPPHRRRQHERAAQILAGTCLMAATFGIQATQCTEEETPG